MTPDLTPVQAPLFDQLVAALDAAQLRYQADRAQGRAQFSVTTDAAELRVVAMTSEDRELVSFYANYGVLVPADRTAVVAELLHRINDLLAIGNFEFDADRRTIRFKVTLWLCEARVTTNALRRHLMLHLGEADRWAPTLMRVLYGDAEPALAVAAAGLLQRA